MFPCYINIKALGRELLNHQTDINFTFENTSWCVWIEAELFSPLWRIKGSYIKTKEELSLSYPCFLLSPSLPICLLKELMGCSVFKCFQEDEVFSNAFSASDNPGADHNLKVLLFKTRLPISDQKH